MKTTSETLGLIEMGKDMGLTLTGGVWIDASAALGIISRKGSGKIRHLDTQWLWIQQREARKDVEVSKVLGTENPADLMTKGLDEVTTVKHLARMGFTFRAGRAEKAVALNAAARVGRKSMNQ